MSELQTYLPIKPGKPGRTKGLKLQIRFHGQFSRAMTHSLSEGENALVGITAGIADITCIQWAYYLKNARQQRLPLTFNPRILYRGYLANCANVAAGTSFQFATAGALNKLVLRGAQRELTDVEKVGTGLGRTCYAWVVFIHLAHFASVMPKSWGMLGLPPEIDGFALVSIPAGFVAGFASGVVAAPAELVMTQQQLRGGSVSQNARTSAVKEPQHQMFRWTWNLGFVSQEIL